MYLKDYNFGQTAAYVLVITICNVKIWSLKNSELGKRYNYASCYWFSDI